VENLIAAFQKTETKLLVEVESPEDARLFLETLEVGAHGIVVVPQDKKTIVDIRELTEGLELGTVELVEARITKIKSIGTGDRVCVDSCSVMELGEGMLIGSQSSGLFLVHSESVESEFVDTRPFRVNAGSVHSYILAKKDRTKYLSDLAAGDDIMVVDSSGNTRPVVLGRVKIEKRPLVLLETEYQGRTFNIILQNAETIRLVSEGKPVSIIDLKEGDSVLMFVEEGGRHFGMKVDESIVEK
jgi:3-dehydroquinate synthase II